MHKSGAKVIHFVNTAYDFDKKNHFFAAFCAQKVIFYCFCKETASKSIFYAIFKKNTYYMLCRL